MRFSLAGGVPDVAALGEVLAGHRPARVARTSRRSATAPTRIADPLLRRQALDSIRAKSYHAAGAAILAAFLPTAQATRYVDIVVPLESIYDYLDNLCDRHPAVPAAAYPVLHGAIADALDPSACAAAIITPPARAATIPAIFAGWSSAFARGFARSTDTSACCRIFVKPRCCTDEMQTFVASSGRANARSCVRMAWFAVGFDRRFEALTWDEFACAAGSQFQVYGPLFELLRSGRTRSTQPTTAYFPAISALHVFLDSYIDQAEDRARRRSEFRGARPRPKNATGGSHCSGAGARRGLGGSTGPLRTGSSSNHGAVLFDASEGLRARARFRGAGAPRPDLGGSRDAALCLTP